MTKLLIAGASGLFGLNLTLQAKDRYRVVAAHHSHPVREDAVETMALDLTDAAVARRQLASAGADIIVNASGLTDVDRCEVSPALARVMNVDAAVLLADVAAACGARFVHLSTDHLWDGTRPLRSESDPVAPMNVYARTKADAEAAVSRACPSALIVRTNFYGWGSPHRTSFSDWILQALRDGRELTMFTDVHFTPILVNDLIDLVLELIETRAEGLVHVAGSERLSKHEFACRLADRFGYSRALLHPASVEGFAFKAPRPRDMSLACRKAEAALGRDMPSVDAGLERLEALGRAGWPGRLESAVVRSAILPENA
jgi:dTDP-4-dehydrorhamnose reductase